MNKFTDKLNESDEKILNWVVSYTKDRGMDFDLSISSESLDSLILKLKESLPPSEYDSIFKIELGTLDTI